MALVRLMSRLDHEPEVFQLRGLTKRMTWLSGRDAAPGTGPEVFYSETLGAGAVTKAHFHQVDQFRLFVEGDQRIGSQPIDPLFLHYADAHTPYGPIIGGASGVHYLTCRAICDPGALFMPESRPQRRVLHGRHASVAVGPTAPSDPPAWRALIDAHDDGLMANVVDLAPHAMVTSCGPARGAGQLYVVARGTLRHEGRDHPVLSSVFVAPGEDVGRLDAGAVGATVVLMGFPTVEPARANTGGV